MRRRVPTLSILVLLLAILAAACGNPDRSTEWDVATTGSDQDSGSADNSNDGTGDDGDAAGGDSANDGGDDGQQSSGTTAPTTTEAAGQSPTTTRGSSTKQSETVLRVLQAADASAAIADVRMVMAVEMAGLPDFQGEVVRFGIEAAIAGDGSQGEFVMDLSGMLGAIPADEVADMGPFLDMFAEPVEMRYTADTVYVSSGFVAWLVPVETPWVSFPAESSDPMGDFGFEGASFSAAELLAVLKGLDADAEAVGRETIDGIETTHISGRFSVASLAALDADFDLSEIDPTGLGGLEAEVMNLDVWIDDDDIVRRFRFGVDDLAALDPTAPEGAYFWFTIDLRDIGEPLVIEIPPAADVTEMDNIFG